MKTTKNIDRLFQEKLKDFEVAPPKVVWENIELQLKKKKRKRIIPFWWRSGVAAALLIFASIAYFNRPTQNTISDVQKIQPKRELQNIDKNNTIIATKTTETSKTTSEKKQLKYNLNPKGKSTSSTANSNIKLRTKNTSLTSIKNSANINNKYHKEKKELNTSSNNSTQNKSISNVNNTTKIASENHKNETKKEVNSKQITNTPKNNFTKELQKDILKDEPLKKKVIDTKKWSVASVIAPVYYNSFYGNGSPLDSKFENNPKKGSKTMSYGVKVAYKFNSKLSLQSGVSVVNVGYKVSNVFINPSQQYATRLTNVNYTATATILNVNTTNILNSATIETPIITPTKGTLNQEFGYIEIPLEIKYNLRNKNSLVGINLIGGFSTLLLNKNNVYVETAQFSSNLGEATNLNKINFSGNLGLDIDYKINKQIYFNIAPMLKIHANTFSKNDGNFKPYILGVYTGLNYKF